MKKQEVQTWLDQYGKAWIEGDPAQIIALFSTGAAYREAPFDDAMIGHQAIQQYWQEGAADAQEDVQFSSQVWAVDGNEAAAGWQARFTRKRNGTRVKLDGTFRLKFSEGPESLLCDSLEEWWHSQDV